MALKAFLSETDVFTWVLTGFTKSFIKRHAAWRLATGQWQCLLSPLGPLGSLEHLPTGRKLKKKKKGLLLQNVTKCVSANIWLAVWRLVHFMEGIISEEYWRIFLGIYSKASIFPGGFFAPSENTSTVWNSNFKRGESTCSQVFGGNATMFDLWR